MEQDIKKKMYFYEESLASSFDEKMNKYDVNKRIDVVFNEMLNEDIKGRKFLDAGCGTGLFSKVACDRGADVYSMDLGENLLNEVKKKCNSNRVVGSILEIPFPDNTFDIVMSSEVIEHVPDPKKAIAELYRVLKPGGIMVLTTPNKFWYFAIWIANTFKLRPYQGLENWTGWWEMQRTVNNLGFKTEKQVGVHLFPFVLKFTYPILNFFHSFNKILGPFMVNIAIKCKK